MGRKMLRYFYWTDMFAPVCQQSDSCKIGFLVKHRERTINAWQHSYTFSILIIILSSKHKKLFLTYINIFFSNISVEIQNEN